MSDERIKMAGAAAGSSVVNLADVRRAQARELNQNDGFAHEPFNRIAKAPTAPQIRLNAEAIYELLDPLYEMLEQRRQAQLKYDAVMAEVARRTGRDSRTLGAMLRHLRRTRATRPEPPEWWNLM